MATSNFYAMDGGFFFSIPKVEEMCHLDYTDSRVCLATEWEETCELVLRDRIGEEIYQKS